MVVKRGYRVELDLNDHQRTACKKHVGASRWAYNYGLRRKQEAYAAGVPTPLLVSWSPAPQFWHAPQDERSVNTLSIKIFPIVKQYAHNVFIAPEILYGVCDERADIYLLGAILFLLVTHYAPIAALRRLYASQRALLAAEEGLPLAEQDIESLDFTSLQALDSSIPPALECVLLCALNLDPDLRYGSVADLIVALQAVMRDQEI